MAVTINASTSSGLQLTSDTSGAIAFQSNGSTAVTLASNGNIGVGTTSPQVSFDVWAPSHFVANLGGTFPSYGSNIGANGGLVITWNGQSNTHGETDFINFPGGGTGGFNWHLGSNTGSVTSAPSMMLDGNGYFLIGYSTSNGAYKLQVNSQIFATSATIATSDGRYKENVTSLDGALDLVTQLNPVQFTWKEHPVHNFDRAQPTVGFIAQEVQEVLKDKPYLNSIIKNNECTLEQEEKDAQGNVTKPAVTEDFYGIAEGNLIALLTKALQEANAKIDALTERVEALEARP